MKLFVTAHRERRRDRGERATGNFSVPLFNIHYDFTAEFDLLSRAAAHPQHMHRRNSSPKGGARTKIQAHDDLLF